MTEHRDYTIKDICLVVVTYFPDSNFPERAQGTSIVLTPHSSQLTRGTLADR